MRNKTTQGKCFSDHDIQKVWEKARPVSGVDPDVYRKDHCGAWIKRNDYGKNDSSLSTSWEIDHIKPKNKGGGDELNNLQPLQWENNKGKSDHYPQWDCSVTSLGSENMYLK